MIFGRISRSKYFLESQLQKLIKTVHPRWNALSPNPLPWRGRGTFKVEKYAPLSPCAGGGPEHLEKTGFPPERE
jgi:hypothetical protein